VGRRSPAERQTVEQAFRDFRADLWHQYPMVTPNGDDSVGAALLRDRQTDVAVPVLICEALALSEPAQRLLETVYEQGVAGQLAAYDPRILAYFKTAAAEGAPRARVSLARIYARGLGVPPDLERAVALLKATPHEDARRLLQELSTNPSSPTRP
jgi:TPR repeat protein